MALTTKTTLWHLFSDVQHFPVNQAKCFEDYWWTYTENHGSHSWLYCLVGSPPALGARPFAKPAKRYSYCDCFGSRRSATKANGVCVSLVTVGQRHCRPTEPTRTRRVRLRVGLNTHSHSSLLFFPRSPLHHSLFSLNLLNARRPCFPHHHRCNHSRDLGGFSCPAPPSVAGKDGCYGNHSVDSPCPCRPLTWHLDVDPPTLLHNVCRAVEVDWCYRTRIAVVLTIIIDS